MQNWSLACVLTSQGGEYVVDLWWIFLASQGGEYVVDFLICLLDSVCVSQFAKKNRSEWFVQSGFW